MREHDSPINVIDNPEDLEEPIQYFYNLYKKIDKVEQ
jgi:hypothetical protein